MTMGTSTERHDGLQIAENGHLGSRFLSPQTFGRLGLLFLALCASIVVLWQIQTDQNPLGLCSKHRIGSSCHIDVIGGASKTNYQPSDNTADNKVMSKTINGVDNDTATVAPILYLDESSVNAVQKASYLLYFSESGWANQEICMEHAFYIARALNRTLILPPVLPHLGKGSLSARDVLNLDTHHFKTAVDPLKFYVNKLPRHKYVPIDRVLDIPFSFADVPVMDVLEFYDSVLATSMNMSKWVIESNYSHYNTRWILDQSQIEGESTVLIRQEYGQTVELQMVNRDIVKTVGDNREDILVLLDGFKSIFDESSSSPPFQPRVSEPIRKLAQTVREKWHVPAYAAVHLRGGDGQFAEENKIQETIVAAMSNITDQMIAWLLKSSDGAGKTAIGLYVATDVENIFNHSVMAREVTSMVERIHNSGNTIVDFLSSKDLLNQSQILNDLRYSNIFLDLQMAVCATVGFVGTEGSTFSNLIYKHRRNPSC